MPGSPVMVRMAPLPSAIASQASSSTASSASRPTSATWRRMWAGPRSPVTRKARTDRSTPFSSTSPSSSSSKQACELARRLGADDDAALGVDRLQPRGHVDRVAERVVALRVVRLGVREHDRAAVDGHAHRELDVVGAAHLVGVGLDRRLDRERRAHAALRVVLVRERRAEHRQQAVAGELRDGAVEAPHLRRHQRDDLVEQELRARRARAARRSPSTRRRPPRRRTRCAGCRPSTPRESYSGGSSRARCGDPHHLAPRAPARHHPDRMGTDPGWSSVASGWDVPDAYVARDRRRALAAGLDLPDRVQGAALFADVSGLHAARGGAARPSSAPSAGPRSSPRASTASSTP